MDTMLPALVLALLKVGMIAKIDAGTAAIATLLLNDPRPNMDSRRDFGELSIFNSPIFSIILNHCCPVKPEFV